MASKPPALDDFEIPYRRLRQPATVNLFKSIALGERHIPEQHQAHEVQRVFADAGLEGILDMRTWRGWFGESPRRARSDGIMALDRFRDVQGDPNRRNFLSAVPTSRYFGSLLEGGLLADLLKPTEAKHASIALAQRAMEYQHASPVHLHFDAVEAAAVSVGNGDVPWEQIKAISARRIMDLLHARWSPRHGTVFASLTSSLKLKWGKADGEEQEHIRQAYARFTPNLFDHYWNMPPHPDWVAVGLDSDIGSIHVHRLLLALSIDTDFLVADRLDSWALDLASAALAMHALAWSERYHTHGAAVTPELIYWRAFHFLLFAEEADDDVDGALIAALEMTKVSWTAETLATLYGARRSYREQLARLGVCAADVGTVVRRCWNVLPVGYRGKARTE